MSKSIVKANQKKRRISNRERDDLNHLEEEQQNKMSWQEIEPPSFLDRKQKNTFRKYATLLGEINVITATDADVLGHYVYFQSVFHDLVELVKKEGYVLNGKIHPALGEMRQLSRVVHTHQVKLGLNPTDRLRFVDKVEVEKDEFEEFMQDYD